MAQAAATLLESLASRLRARFGADVACSLSDDRLTINVRRWPDAQLTVTVTDPVVPYFAASYPALTRTAKGRTRRHDDLAPRVLDAGIEWMVGKLVKYGVVPDEAAELGL